MENQLANQLTKKVTSLLEELFQQENVENSEKILRKNGINIKNEDLQNFH